MLVRTECVFLTPSTAHSGSALERSACWKKDKCRFPESSLLLKRHSHCSTLENNDKKNDLTVQ